MTSKPDRRQGPNRAEDAYAVMGAERLEARKLVAALADATTTAVRQHTALLLRITEEVRACALDADATIDPPADDGADASARGTPLRRGRSGDPFDEPAA